MAQYPKRARAYAMLDRFFRRSVNLAIVIHEGFWLGFLDLKQTECATELHYTRQLGQYVDETYNLGGLKRWEQSVLTKYFHNAKSVLVGASGGGREVIALNRGGYQADGFECCFELADYSRDLIKKEGVEAVIYDSEPGEAPSIADTYDSLIVGWGGYMHIRGRALRIKFLQQLRSHIVQDGPMLLSFFARGESRQFERIRKAASVVAYLFRNQSSIETGDRMNGSFDHYFTREEIRDELRDGGFEMIFYADDEAYPHAVAKAV